MTFIGAMPPFRGFWPLFQCLLLLHRLSSAGETDSRQSDLLIKKMFIVCLPVWLVLYFGYVSGYASGYASGS